MHDICDYWLVTTEGIGIKSYQKLLRKGLGGEEILKMPEEGIKRLGREGILTGKACKKLIERKRKCSKGQLIEELRALSQRGISFCLYGGKDYPKRLMHIPDPPPILYYRGSLPKEESLTAAVIGARDCSEYGAYVAKEIGKELARQNITIVSGMARGVDGICQKSALAQDGSVFAVLGSGVDICYPKENMPLYEQLCLGKQQGVLSEYAPGTEAKASLFPPRNRIISGLSDVIIVVEARLKSGTLITVDMALEQGKEIYAVPGRITDRLSDGCNRLIRDGALPFLSPHDFVQDILHKKEALMFHKGTQPQEVAKKAEKNGAGRNEMSRSGAGQSEIQCLGGRRNEIPSSGAGHGEDGLEKLTETERAVYEHMDIVPKSIDWLMGQVRDIPLQDLLCAVAMLQVKGLVGVRGNAYYRILG